MKKSKDAWKKVLNDAWKKRSMAFRKKWVPFLLNFAQTNLSKESKLTPYWKAISFLSSGPETEFHLFDEESFDSWWKAQATNYPIIDLEKLQLELRKVLKYWKRKDLEDLPPFTILYYMKTNSGLFISRGKFIIKPWLDYADIGPTQKITWLFMRMLDGLPLDSIRKCKGCDHYFLHTSKRERIFCTPTCASRSIQEGKREKLKTDHPRKHKQFLLEQKFRMGELRKGPREYTAYLRKTNRDDWEVYKRWRVRNKKKRGGRIKVR